MCHGQPDDILDAVKPELAKRYPGDEATGFKLDDLRGWFWVEDRQAGKKLAKQDQIRQRTMRGKRWRLDMIRKAWIGFTTFAVLSLVWQKLRLSLGVCLVGKRAFPRSMFNSFSD